MTERDQLKAIAFTFGRLLGDAEFRSHVDRLQTAGQRTIIPALDHESVYAVITRVLKSHALPATIALARPNERWGIGLLTLEVAAAGASDADKVPVDKEATIGMLYDLLEAPSQDYSVLNEWFHIERLGA